jgi:hypothetical protein
VSPELLAALIGRIAIPELFAWLAQLRAEGRVVTEEEALAKLELDVTDGNAIGQAFLDSHPKT